MDALDTLPPKLRPLGLKVPYESRVSMGPAELKARCEHAADLLDRGKEREAGKVLKAMSLKAFMMASNLLQEEIRQARLDNSDPAIREATGTYRRLLRDHPQAMHERVEQGDASTVEAILIEISNTTSVRQRRRWQFWKRS